MLTLHSTAACGFPLYLNYLPHLSSYFAMPASPPAPTKTHTNTHTRMHATMNLKLAELVQQKPLKEQKSSINIGGCILHTFSSVQAHADAGSNMETYYKQVGFYFYWNTYSMLYSWQLPETYMQSAPAALRLKHARCIMLKTGKMNQKKKQNKAASLPPIRPLGMKQL